LPDPPSLHEQRQVIAEHYQIAEQLYGEERCLPPMRKFGIKYAQLHPQSTEVREAFVQVRMAGQWKSVLERWYADDLPGVHPKAEEPNPRSSEAAPSGDEGSATAAAVSG
jgi:tRNA-dihydrouridine synthase B